MKLAIMQPYLFPYFGYFQLIDSVDRFVFYDDVPFIKQGWINRNNILLNGKKYLFSIPLAKISSFNSINEIIISEKPGNWEKKLLSTLAQAYLKAPNYKIIFPLVENVIKSCKGKSISDLAKKSVLLFKEYLGIETEIVCSSVIYQNQLLKAEARVKDICLRERADVYINMIGGKDLYNKENFAENGNSAFFPNAKACPVSADQQSIYFTSFYN